MKNISNFYKLSLVFLFAVSTLTINAQKNVDRSIDWTQKLKVPNVQNIDILKMDSTALYYLSSNIIDHKYIAYAPLSKPHLYRYDRLKNQAIDHEIVLKNGGTHRTFEKAIPMGNTIHVFTSYIDTEKKMYYLFDETLGQDSLKSNNDEKIVFELNYGALNHPSVNTLYSLVHIDGNRFDILTTVKTADGYYRKNNIMDLNMQQKSTFTYYYSGKDLTNALFIADHKDNLYVLNAYQNEKKEEVYDILYFSKDTSEVKKQTIVGIQVVGNLQLAINKNNELILAGLFSNLKRQSAIGTFSVLFPAELSRPGKMNSSNFSDEFLSSGYSKKEAAKRLKDIKDGYEFNDGCSYTVKPIQLWDNGEFSFTCEKSKVTVKTTNPTTYTTSSGTYSSNNTKIFYLHTYDDIYVCTFKKDGEIKWCQNVPRNVELHAAKKHVGHYVPIFGKDNSVNLVLNSFKKSISPFVYMLNMNEMNVEKTYLISFDTNGNRKVKVLISDPKLAKKIVPVYSKGTDEGRLLITRMEPFTFNVSYGVGEVNIP